MTTISPSVINLNNKSLYTSLYKKSIEQYWVPETVNLATDKIQWLTLDPELKTAILSMLKYAIVLDSHQVSNVAGFCQKLDEPDLKALLSVHSFMESVHSASYSYFAETVCLVDERKMLYELDDEGAERLGVLTQITKEYGDVVANYWLEAVAFQGLFRLADILRSKDLLPGLSTLIQLISRDENLHIKTFAALMSQEQKQLTYDAFIHYAPIEGTMIKNLTGIPEFYDYYVFVAAYYLKSLGLKTDYVNDLVDKGSPFAHLWDLGDSSKKKLKGNFFTSSLVYDNSRPDLNWDVNSWFNV